MAGAALFLLRPKVDQWKPGFIGAAALLQASDDMAGTAIPFRKRIRPNYYQVLDSKGVSWRDYLIEGSFDALHDSAKKEFPSCAGWEELYTTPNGNAAHIAREMDV